MSELITLTHFDWKVFFGVAAAMVAVVNYLPYLVGVYTHTFKPHVFSWIVWSCMTAITFFAQLSDGAGPGAWATGVTAVTLLVIVFFTLKNNNHAITRFDWISFVGALVAIPIWIYTGNPLLSVIIISAAEAMGFFPTFRKGFLYPKEESVLAFSLTTLKYSLALLALTHYSIVTTLFPFTLVTLSGSLVVMLLWRRRYV